MNVGDWTAKWADLYPNEPSVKCGDLSFTRREFNNRVNQMARALQAKGIQKGDRVAGLLANGNEFLEILFACSKLGVIMVPLNFRLAAPELEYILKDSEPKLFFYSPEFLATVGALRGKTPGIQEYISERPGGTPNDAEYGSWISAYPVAEPEVKGEVTLDDPQFIMYTSGTTGRPKGAVLTQGNTQWNAINGIVLYGITKQHVGLTSAPLFHIGGLSASATPTLYVGGRLVIQRLFNPSETLKLIEKERVNSMFGIPVMFQFMALVPEFSTADLSSVHYFIAGGAPCPKSLIEIYLKKGVVFNQGYGLTETAPGVSALRSEEAERKLGSAGKPMFHLDLRVVDDRDKPLPPKEMGEVVLRGPNVFKEYWRLPKETAEAKRGGWFHTGDMGYLDEEGYLWLVDRKKDMYISGGENVYPAEVEDVIYKMPQVKEVGVMGMPDPKWGEAGVAVVVPKPGMTLTDQEVLAFCQGKLAKYKIPKRVVFTEALPRTATGKVLKKELRAKYL